MPTHRPRMRCPYGWSTKHIVPLDRTDPSFAAYQPPGRLGGMAVTAQGVKRASNATAGRSAYGGDDLARAEGSYPGRHRRDGLVAGEHGGPVPTCSRRGTERHRGSGEWPALERPGNAARMGLRPRRWCTTGLVVGVS